MKIVTARFKVSRRTPFGSPEATEGEVEMTPDYANGKNAEWSKLTPSGVFRLHTTNPDAFEAFEPGSEVEIEMKIQNPSQFT